jgi:hypothetical protein
MKGKSKEYELSLSSRGSVRGEAFGGGDDGGKWKRVKVQQSHI